jgi:OmpA-OmpF porin, OOP family
MTISFIVAALYIYNNQNLLPLFRTKAIGKPFKVDNLTGFPFCKIIEYARMKQIIRRIAYTVCLLLGLLLCQPELAFSQRDMLGANAIMMDYQGPYDNGFDNFRRYYSGVELYYRRSLTQNLGISVPFRIGVARKTEALSNFTLMGLDARLHYHFNKPGNLVIPFLFAGAGFVRDVPGDFRGEIPLGGGLDIPIAPQIGIQVYASYRLGLSEQTSSFQHGAGFVYRFGQKPKPAPKVSDLDQDGVPDSEDECPTIAGLPELMGCPDTDGDGIPDHKDDCPNFAGTIEFNGCPDSDGDGIPDHLDNCPTVPGLKENGGCPIGDSDSDGIPDDEDRCPEEYGLKIHEGCPDTDGDGIPDFLDDCPKVRGPKHLKGCPDSDGDGVPDYLDKCVLIPGPVSNFGCPELKKEEKEVLTNAMQAVQFDLNSSVLRQESFAVLDQVVGIMKRYDYYTLSIEGHTDSTGDPSFNLLLSENRANACKEYIISKGVDKSRVTSKGFGRDKPLYDNATPEGRRLNRRVEFNMKLK